MARRPLTVLPLARLVLIPVLAAVLVPLATPTPAGAAARVTVANADGDPVADPTYATTVRVSGRGFQSVRGGYGGIYVFFGTVRGTWQPSRGGQTGRDYLYVPDAETKDNQGYQRFVAFPGGDTADAANGGTIAADGTWSTTLTIPGSSFRTLDRSGRATTVDCRTVSCGIITIGAHGVVNARNESFTRVRFADLYGTSTAPPASATPDSSAAATPAGRAPSGPVSPVRPVSPVTPAASAPAVPAAKPAAATGPAAVTVDRATAVAGRVLTFTASGLRPGEQVVASLDDGAAAVGPLSAGASGEVAGVLRLPLTTVTGTHVLKLTGAASGSTPTVAFAVAAPAGPAGPSGPSGTVATDGGDRTPYAFLAVALLVLVAAVLASTLRGRLRRRGRPAPTVSEAPRAV